MLALAYAAAHPDSLRCVVLIGCGTFGPAARDRLEATRKERMDEHLASRMERLEEEYSNPDQRLLERYDARAHKETWQDMLRLQAEGVYPSAFVTIRSRAIMMHGVVDPHPGRMIYASLVPYLPHLEYRAWEQCGHYPWLEKAVRDEFHAALKAWLLRHAESATPPPR
jgi:pimeloyl-ACP methyl ester carboxylesterase